MKNIQDEFDRIFIGPYNKGLWRTPAGKNLRMKLQLCLNEFDSLEQKVYALRHKLLERPICCVCKGPASFRAGTFNPTCGNPRCAKMNPEAKLKAAITNNERYGGNSPMSSQEVREKSEQTCLKNHGVRVSSQSSRIYAKVKQTNLEKHGVECILDLQSVRIKAVCGAQTAAAKTKRMKSIDDHNAVFGAEARAKKLQQYGQNVLPSRLEELKNSKNIVPLFSKWVGSRAAYEWQHLDCGYQFSSVFTATQHMNCPRCSPRSMPQAIVEQMCSDLGLKFTVNTRKVIPPYEIDIFIEHLNIGIEVNGVYWHRDDSSAIPLLTKTKLAEENGIQLLHFWDYEILQSPQKVQDIIQAKAGALKRRVYARKCELQVISSKEARQFFVQTHASGFAKATTHLGLVFNGELVCAASFGRPRFSKTEGSTADELIRFACAYGTHVPGGLSRICKRQMQNSRKDIISFADRRFSLGKAYLSSGFVFEGTSKPNYVYVKGEKIVQRYAAMKHKLKDLLGDTFNAELSEGENMQNHGWLRISDAGNLKFRLRSKA